jgi:hypothetical protein
MTPQQAHFTALRNGLLPLWNVFERPGDHPDTFVARMFVVGRGTHAPTSATVKGNTLEEVRKALPQGLVCVRREPGDDPKIVEVWL